MSSTLINKLKKTNLLRPILAVLILFIPLYPKFPLQTVKGTYVAIRLDDIVISITILAWLIYQIKSRFPILKQKITLLFALYLLSISLSTIHAILIFQTDPTHILLLHLFRRFEYMSLFFVTISAIKPGKKISFPYTFLFISTLIVCFYGYGQKYLNFPVVSTMNSEFSKGQILQMSTWARISSTFAGHYDLAAYLSLVLVIITGIIATGKKLTIKIINIIFWLITFSVLTLTASRISIFAFWGAATFTLLMLKKYLWIIPISAIIIFTILTSQELNQRLIATIRQSFPTSIPTQAPTNTPAPIPTIDPSIPTSTPASTPAPKTSPLPTPLPTVFRNPLPKPPPLDPDAGVARSGEIRFKAEWPRAITAYKKNPLNGTGPGSITLATDNDYLRMLGESGLLGFISFTAIFVWFFVKTIPSIKTKNRNHTDHLNIIFLGAVFSFMANAIFIDVFEASKTAYSFWIMMGIYHQTLNPQND